ncbi:hypothetical protein I546_6684 [Mycobacterium kansasii 732]|nr:hypothetical protein I546_7287 [Mycobacterium kansasii 732]ETZ99693.1 hypothetical protein I546_6684 [Mycobacterium kansasii 732]
MRAISYRDLARQHRAKLLQSVACAVGAGKTVAVRASAASLDPSRHVFIYLANPTVGVRGMLTHIVATLGHTPAFHRSALTPQAAEALATEHAERAETPSWSSTKPTSWTTISSKRSDC